MIASFASFAHAIKCSAKLCKHVNKDSGDLYDPSSSNYQFDTFEHFEHLA
jgi:hypothetical protein